ncbi:MAG TPA: hypothetical protein VEK57_01930 [Thermoanaerobaculia bacterium]|nr:hypothetical protein [Thermoanaerobaculia bacterium]
MGTLRTFLMLVAVVAFFPVSVIAAKAQTFRLKSAARHEGL